MHSPCKDCTRRCADPNCHNVDTCPEWRAYVAEKTAERDANFARKDAKYQEIKDYRNHMRRHSKSVQKGRK